jgi:hypothetical protein
MMRTAVIQNGVVQNIIVAGPDFVIHGAVLIAVGSDPVEIGDIYDGENFIPAPPQPAPVPTSVTPLQMRKALRAAGLKPAMDAMLATLPEEVVEEWEYALAIERQNPLLQGAAAQLGMTSAQVDDLFRLAATMTT